MNLLDLDQSGYRQFDASISGQAWKLLVSGYSLRCSRR
jgi:hypothetical protein